MVALTTAYWLCFGIGLVYVLVAGTLGAVSHGLESLSDVDTDVDHDFDHDFDADHDFDVDHDVGFDVDHDVGVDFDHDAGFDVAADHDAGFDFGADHDIDVGAADFDVGVPDADLDVGVDVDAGAGVDFDAAADTDVGLDVDHDADTSGAGHFATHEMPDWNPFSPLSIAGFLCAFGGGGLLATGYGLGLGWSLVAAVVGGILMAFVLWLVIGKFLFGMQGTSQARAFDMLGLEADVITPVEHELCGEIAYILEGVRYTAPARLISEGKAAKYDKVRIRKVRGNMAYVEPKKKLLA